jgi:hypothetical protein
MQKKLLAAVVLAVAVMASFAASAAPDRQTQIAEERAAPMPLVDLVPAHAAQPFVQQLGDRFGKLEVLQADHSAALIPSSPARVAAAAVWMHDRESIVYHLRL